MRNNVIRRQILLISLICIAVLLICLPLSSCGKKKAPVDDAEEEEEKRPEATEVDSLDIPLVSSPSGEYMAGDGNRLFFYYDDTNVTDEREGIYQTDLKKSKTKIITDGWNPCSADGRLYVSYNGEIDYLSKDFDETKKACETDGGAENMSYYSGSIGGKKGKYLFFTDQSGMHAGKIIDDGRVSIIKGDFFNRDGVDILSVGDSMAFFSGGSGLTALDLDSKEETEVTDANIYAACAIGDTVYFLTDMEDYPDSGKKGASIELAFWTPGEEVVYTRLLGKFEPEMLLGYGDYLFYSRQIYADSYEVRPYCYNTKTDEEFKFERSQYEDDSIKVFGVSDGYMYIMVGPYGLPEKCLLESISDPDVSVDLIDLVKGSGKSGAIKKIEDDEKKAEEEKQAREEEERRNEPYGPGTSKLYLEAPDDQYACYRLVRRDGTYEFQELLKPGESIMKEFPCGRYTLKIAKGDKWISDEEAFGETGHYSTTELFTFEDGEAYQIGSGSEGNVYGDSQSGFNG